MIKIYMINKQFKPNPRSVQPPKRADLITDEIKRWIIAGQLHPGDRLPGEAELMSLLKSSRGTVREALKVLESQGLVEIVRGPNGGARVSHVSYGKTSSALRNFLYFQPLTWSNIYHVREQLEPVMAASVVDLLTPADIAALRETVHVCEQGIKGEIDPRSHRIAELEFHSILSRACTNPLLNLLCCFINEILRDLSISDPRNIIQPKDSSFALEAVKFHTALIEAYEAKDARRVQDLMSEHVCCGGNIVAQREGEIDQSNLLLRQALNADSPRRRLRGDAGQKSENMEKAQESARIDRR